MGKSSKRRATKAPAAAAAVARRGGQAEVPANLLAAGAAPVMAAAKKGGAKKTGTKKAGPKKAASDKAAVKKGAASKVDMKKGAAKNSAPKQVAASKAAADKPAGKKVAGKRAGTRRTLERLAAVLRAPPPLSVGSSAAVLDRLWSVVDERRDADPGVSHSARLLGRGTAKVAQKFGEEAVELLIEAVAGNREALIAESADVLYHLIVVWVNAGVRSEEVWHELQKREGVSGIAEKASRARSLPLELGLRTTKIP